MKRNDEECCLCDFAHYAWANLVIHESLMGDEIDRCRLHHKTDTRQREMSVERVSEAGSQYISIFKVRPP
jgi:hypothetical protein